MPVLNFLLNEMVMELQ